MKVCSCIIAYVYSQWWYCADRSYAFLNMGGVRSRKYCASISDMTTKWGLRREVVLRINLPRASIEAWRMLWHLSSNGSRGWLRNWGKGYVCREVSSARITSRGNNIWQFKQWYILSSNNIIGGIATWGVYYLARIPVQIVLLNEGYHYQNRSLFEVKTGWVHWCAMIPCAISPPPSWVSYPLSVCYGLSVLILIWLLSFNQYAVLVARQNLLGRCCIPMNQSSVNMVTTDDNSLSFQCLGSIFWGQTKCWMNTPSSGSPPTCNVSPHWACQYTTPSIFPATVALWTLAFQNCLYLTLYDP